jgi:acyl-CoA synthetase (AMP-forming)/AMP-acid ligase II
MFFRFRRTPFAAAGGIQGDSVFNGRPGSVSGRQTRFKAILTILGTLPEEQSVLSSYGQPGLGFHITVAAVLGNPDPIRVEQIHALVALKEGMKASAEEIISFCKKHIATYKTPKSVEFIDSLPKNPQGKILKKKIRAKYWPQK